MNVFTVPIDSSEESGKGAEEEQEAVSMREMAAVLALEQGKTLSSNLSNKLIAPNQPLCGRASQWQWPRGSSLPYTVDGGYVRERPPGQ